MRRDAVRHETRLLASGAPTPGIGEKARAALGVVLFVGALVYALASWPGHLLDAEPGWLALTALALTTLLASQALQFAFFARHHGFRGLSMPTRLTLQRGIFNTILPAKAGTVALAPLVRRHLGIPIAEYARFTLVAAVVALGISALAFAHLALSLAGILTTWFGTVVLVVAFTRAFAPAYTSVLPRIALAGTLGYASLLLAYGSVLRSLGMTVGFREASAFAIAVNTISVVAVTPGNLGIREVVLGALAPYVALPASAGVLAGAGLMAIRFGLSIVFLALLRRSTADEAGPSTDAPIR